MDSQQLRDLQAPLKQKYREQPDAARATLQAIGELDFNNIACRLTGRGESFAAGLHPLAGGDEKWACSGEMLLEALAACAGVTLCAVATAMEVPVTSGPRHCGRGHRLCRHAGSEPVGPGRSDERAAAV